MGSFRLDFVRKEQVHRWGGVGNWWWRTVSSVSVWYLLCLGLVSLVCRFGISHVVVHTIDDCSRACTGISDRVQYMYSENNFVQ